jgi:hypothetical protein
MSETNLLSANNTNNPNNIKILKYPVPRLEYTYKTGSIAEKLISDILKDEGIEVEPHNVNENGVDIRAKDVDIGIEVWNWCKPHEYNSRIQSIIENLKPYPFRALVTSFISKDVRDYIESTYVLSPIFVVELGFQILPKEWKQFYKNRKNVVYYPSREAYVKVRQKMKPLIDAIKRVRRDKILAKYFPSYDYGDMVILDATGCTNEEFNNFLRDLKEHKEKVTLITVQDPSVESPSKKLLSTKEGFNAYVYESILNSKNEKLNISSKNVETGNRRAITEERTESSTFKDKFRTKLRSAFGNLLFKTKMLVLNLFHDTSGRLPRTTEYKTRKWIMSGYGNRSILEYCSDKMKRSKLHPIIKTCPYKTILVCKMKYFKPKYVCGFPFQNKIRYCNYCEDLLDEDNMDLYGRPICKFYNERCDVILQSYEYVNLENSQICYWISRSERVKVLKELKNRLRGVKDET